MRTYLHSRKRRPLRRAAVERLEDRLLMAFDPSGLEQEMLEDVNRMRIDPQGELSVLFSSIDPLVARDPDSQAAIEYFGDPSSAEIQADWPKLAAAPPLAWNESLYNAAMAHNQKMIEHDQQSHQFLDEAPLGQRLTAAGYEALGSYGENIYAYAYSVIHGHGSFAIDWAVADRGHRTNMMKAVYQEVGIGIANDQSGVTQVGPLVITQDFASRAISANPFLLGVVYQDANQNGFYDAGEGLGGVNVQIAGAGGNFSLTTLTAGSYQSRVPNGTYTVTASGGGLNSAIVRTNVVVGASNVKVDLVPSAAVKPNLDVDDNQAVEAMKDGMLILRYYFDFRGPALVKGALGTNAKRTDPAAIATFLDAALSTMLDVDWNQQNEPMKDGMLILRYLFDFRGPSLVNGVLGQNAQRTESAAVATFLDGFQPTTGKGAWAPAADELHHATRDILPRTRRLRLS